MSECTAATSFFVEFGISPQEVVVPVMNKDVF
jgi:hypothetical protein